MTSTIQFRLGCALPCAWILKPRHAIPSPLHQARRSEQAFNAKKLLALHMGHWHQRTGYLRMWHERFQSESHESHCSLKSSATKAFRNSSNKTSSWPVNNAAIAAASQPVVGMAHCKITHLCATQNRLHLSGLRGIIRPFGEPLRY